MTEITPNKDPRGLRTGTAMGAGEFVLDEKRALAKLQKFQLPSPHHYLLEFVKAAHLLGAEQINFRLTIDEVEVAFDGEALSPDELEILYSSPFSQRGEGSLRALRHLAIGANAARGLGLREFIIDIAGDEPHGVCVVGDEISEREIVLDENSAWTTRLYLRRRRAQLSKLKRFVNQAMGTRGEVDLLRERCHYSSVDVRVNEVRVSQGMTLSKNARSVVKITGPAEKGRLGIHLSSRRLKTVVLQHGIIIRRGRKLSELWGAEAVIDSGRLATNLSQSAFVEDEAWEQLQKTLERATLRSLALYLQSLDPWVDDAESRLLLDSLIRLSRKITADQLTDSQFDELHTTLQNLSLFDIPSIRKSSKEGNQTALQSKTLALRQELNRIEQIQKGLASSRISPDGSTYDKKQPDRVYIVDESNPLKTQPIDGKHEEDEEELFVEFSKEKPQPQQQEQSSGDLVDQLKSDLNRYGSTVLLKAPLSLVDVRKEYGAVLSGPAGIEMNENHPAVRYAMENPDDPFARAFVLRAIHAEIYAGEFAQRVALDHKLEALLNSNLTQSGEGESIVPDGVW